MVDKVKLGHSISKMQRVKTWQLLILLVIVGFLTATFLRLNNIGMIERRAAVVDADTAGDKVVLQDRLYDLQRYVSTHMNTNMGKGVYLEASYKRDVQAAYDQAAKSANLYGNIYKTVQGVCMPRFTYWSYAYIRCTTDELAKYPASQNLESSVVLPRADTYLHSFVSPLWSPDFAGLFVLIFLAILALVVVRIFGVIVLRLLLRHHYKRI